MILDSLTHPIVQAPMAGGPSTPALAIAVSDAGGLGFLAAGYRSVAEMRTDLDMVRRATRAPFGVNLFVPSPPSPRGDRIQQYLATLGAEELRYGTSLGAPTYSDDGWEAKLEALHAEPAPVVSFTFGCPAASVITALQSVGSEVWVTVTAVAEARLAGEAGADALVVQGWEAGGHQSSFVDLDGAEGVSLAPLLRLVRTALALPLVGTGGIGDGAVLAATLAAGASAGQLGTAFLQCPEAATHPAHRAALREDGATRMTRAFTGRSARGLMNRFAQEHSAGAPAAYPEIHHATAPLRAAARRHGDGGGFNLWAGQAYQLSTALPAAEVVRRFSADAQLALRAAAARCPRASGYLAGAGGDG